MKIKTKLHEDYLSIRNECAIVTAVDGKYAPYLLNALSSIELNFPTHPNVYIYDLGMTRWQKYELSKIPWVEVVYVEKFTKNWKINWSWKPYILNKTSKRYILYFDAANIVVLRDLELWFLAIRKNGYLVFSVYDTLTDATPPEYWKVFQLEQDKIGEMATFGAGIFGYDQFSKGGLAIKLALQKTLDGLNLGRSINERNALYRPNIVRNCKRFRADQTLINLAFRHQYGESLFVRISKRYYGDAGMISHVNQYIWYSRRKSESLVYYWQTITKKSILFYLNRIYPYTLIMLKKLLKKIAIN